MLGFVPFLPTLILLAKHTSKLQEMLIRVKWSGLDLLSYGAT